VGLRENWHHGTANRSVVTFFGRRPLVLNFSKICRLRRLRREPEKGNSPRPRPLEAKTSTVVFSPLG